MGNYIAATDIETRLGQTLTAQLLRESSGGADYGVRLAKVIKTAEEMVDDGYLGMRYAVPVPSSGYVRRLVLAVALYDLYSMGQGGSVPDKARQAYEDALVDLQAVADGKREIGGATRPAAAGLTVGIAVESEPALFDRASLEGF